MWSGEFRAHGVESGDEVVHQLARFTQQLGVVVCTRTESRGRGCRRIKVLRVGTHNSRQEHAARKASVLESGRGLWVYIVESLTMQVNGSLWAVYS